MPTYLTDGINLYEVIAHRTVQNYGCSERSGGRYGPTISYTIIQDCRSGASASFDPLNLSALEVVLTTEL